jgi:hypothetical protein
LGTLGDDESDPAIPKHDPIGEVRSVEIVRDESVREPFDAGVSSIPCDWLRSLYESARISAGASTDAEVIPVAVVPVRPVGGHDGVRFHRRRIDVDERATGTRPIAASLTALGTVNGIDVTARADSAGFHR